MRLVGIAVLAVFLLAGCEQVEVVGHYSVEERAVFDDNGHRVEAVTRVRCTITERPMRPDDQRFSAWHSGPPVALGRADGSLLFLEYDIPCRWEQIPPPGETADLMVQPDSAYGPLPVAAVLVDQGRRPTRASELRMPDGSDGLRLVSLTATTGPDMEPDVSGFRERFSGWRPTNSHAPDFPALMERGRWVLVWSFSDPLLDGACEGEATRVVHERSELPACAQADGQPNEVNMQAQPDAGLTRIDLVALPEGRAGPDRFPVDALRRINAPTLPVENRRSWAPEVCAPGVCVPPEQVVAGAYILDMTGRRVISVHLQGNRLSQSLEERMR